MTFQNASSINAQSGTLNLIGGGSLPNGTINLSGSGIAALAGGTFTIAVSSTFTAPRLTTATISTSQEVRWL